MAKIAELEKQLSQARRELEALRVSAHGCCGAAVHGEPRLGCERDIGDTLGFICAAGAAQPAAAAQPADPAAAGLLPAGAGAAAGGAGGEGVSADPAWARWRRRHRNCPRRHRNYSSPRGYRRGHHHQHRYHGCREMAAACRVPGVPFTFGTGGTEEGWQCVWGTAKDTETGGAGMCPGITRWQWDLGSGPVSCSVDSPTSFCLQILQLQLLPQHPLPHRHPHHHRHPHLHPPRRCLGLSLGPLCPPLPHCPRASRPPQPLHCQVPRYPHHPRRSLGARRALCHPHHHPHRLVGSPTLGQVPPPLPTVQVSWAWACWDVSVSMLGWGLAPQYHCPALAPQ